MKTTHLPKDITTKKSTNWALPDQTVSIDDFKAEIKKAGQGPFIDHPVSSERKPIGDLFRIFVYRKRFQ